MCDCRKKKAWLELLSCSHFCYRMMKLLRGSCLWTFYSFYSFLYYLFIFIPHSSRGMDIYIYITILWTLSLKIFEWLCVDSHVLTSQLLETPGLGGYIWLSNIVETVSCAFIGTSFDVCWFYCVFLSFKKILKTVTVKTKCYFFMSKAQC